MYTNNDILESINNIDDVVYESQVQVMNAWYESYQKQMLLLEYYNGDNINEFSIFQEASGNKPSIGSRIKQGAIKIWEAIKKFFGWIGKQIMRLINLITSAFKKKKKSIDQIAEESGLVPNEVVQEAAIATPNGKLTVGEKDFYIKFNDDDTFSVKNLINIQINMSDSVGVPVVKYDKPKMSFGKKAKVQPINPNDYRVALYYIDNIDRFNDLCRIVDEFAKFCSSIKYDKDKITNISTHGFKQGIFVLTDDDELKRQKDYDPTGKKYSLKQLRVFQKQISKMSEKVSTFNTEELNVENLPQEVLTGMNFCVSKLNTIQMSLNALCNNINQSYVVNKAFVDGTKSVTVLNQFVLNSIKFGVPSKYIAQNTFLVAHPDLKDNQGYKMGQTRMTIFPSSKKEIVLKIALSGMGISANKSEASISDKFVKNGGSNLIAPVLKSCSGDGIIAQKRVIDASTDKEKESAVTDLATRMNAFVRQHNLSNLISDVHTGNIAKDKETGNWVCFDYGMGIRVKKNVVNY